MSVRRNARRAARIPRGRDRAEYGNSARDTRPLSSPIFPRLPLPRRTEFGCLYLRERRGSFGEMELSANPAPTSDHFSDERFSEFARNETDTVCSSGCSDGFPRAKRQFPAALLKYSDSLFTLETVKPGRGRARINFSPIRVRSVIRRSRRSTRAKFI